MTRSSTHQTIIRHWLLLSKLPLNYPGLTAAQLHECLSDAGCEISKRQVERDLLDLESFFALRCNDKGKPYGWFWPEESRKRFFFSSMPAYGNTTHTPQSDLLTQWLRSHDFSLLIEQLSLGFIGRRWLFSGVAEWHHESRSPILLITGAPGVGKSAFAAKLIGRDGLNVVGWYFCRFQRDQLPDAITRDLIQTLAHQLAKKYPAYRNNLLGRFSANPKLTCSETPVRELFEQLVVTPLQQVAPTPERAIIIIDALDEATEKDGAHPLADLLAIAADALPRWIRIVVTSRPAIGIQQRLGRFDSREIHLSEENHLEDIRAYIETQITSSTWGLEKSDKIDTIVQKSEGSFLYVAAIVRALCLDGDTSSRFPANMDDFLRSEFERFFPDIDKYIENQAIPLSIVVAFPGALPEILGAIICGVTQYEWDLRLQPIIGNLLIRTGQGFQPFHRCLFEWLSDKERSWPYTVTQEGKSRIVDYLKDLFVSPKWSDFSPEMRLVALSSLTELVRTAPHWDDVQLLLSLSKQLHKNYLYHIEEGVARRLQTLSERLPEDKNLLVSTICQRAANSRCLGDFEGAIEELERARVLANEISTQQESPLIEIYRQLGLTAHGMKDFNAAGEWFIKALEVFEVTKENEPDHAQLLNNAGRMFMHLPPRRNQAEQFLQQSLHIRTRLFGKKHPRTGATLNNLGYLCMLDNRLEDAEMYFQRALDAKKNIDSGYEQSVSLAHANLGSVYLRLDQAQRAEEHLVIALEHREALHGWDSVPVAKTLEKLCKARLLLKRDDEALNDMRRAVDCYSKSLAPEHLSTLNAMKLLAESQLVTGQKLQAMKTAQAVLEATSQMGNLGNQLRREVEQIISALAS